MKTITIPYDEYLEMEKCKEAIDDIKDKLRRGDNYSYSRNNEEYMERGYLTLYNGKKLFEVFGLLDDSNFDHCVHIEIYR